MQRILVVDPDRGCRANTCVFLRHHAYGTTTVGDVEKAFVRVQSGRYNLVLVEFLPFQGGMWLLREIRKYTSLPVIVWSANAKQHEDFAGEARALDASFLVKGSEHIKADLLRHIEKALSSRNNRRSV